MVRINTHNITKSFSSPKAQLFFSYSAQLFSNPCQCIIKGVGISHFDIGGFTSLYGVVRTEELLLRSAELAVFTPAMRTHEGNRPEDNWQVELLELLCTNKQNNQRLYQNKQFTTHIVQVYSDDYTLTRFARLTRLHKLLGNYTESLINEYNETGIPVQRPVFYEFPNDLCDNEDYKYQYMYGPDLLVAPIYEQGDLYKVVEFFVF